MKCPLLVTFRRVIIKVYKSTVFKVCVQNILHMLTCKFEDVYVAD